MSEEFVLLRDKLEKAEQVTLPEGHPLLSVLPEGSTYSKVSSYDHTCFNEFLDQAVKTRTCPACGGPLRESQSPGRPVHLLCATPPGVDEFAPEAVVCFSVSL